MTDIPSVVIGSIFDRMSTVGVFTIPEIVNRTGISITTVSKYVCGMLGSGVIEMKDTVKTGGRGRQAILYGMKETRRCILGVDVKNDQLIMLMMDTLGRRVRSEVFSDFEYQNTSDCLEKVCHLTEKFISDTLSAEGGEVVQMCLILGGRVNAEAGTSASCFNVEELGDTTLALYLEERFGFGVRVENDTKAMAYGEYLRYKDKGVSDLLYINVGWGLGMGIILEDKLHYGKDGYSGELGHIQAYDNDVLCHCGKVGCLETEVSGRAIRRKILEQVSEGRSSVLAGKVRRGEQIGMNDILEAARKEDPLCVDLISRAGTELGRHISSLINIFNPEVIIIGGALSRAAAYYFLLPIRASVRKYSLKLMSRDVIIESSTMGDDAGAYGACLIAKKKHFERISKEIIEKSH